MVSQMLESIMSKFGFRARDLTVRFHHLAPATGRATWLDVKLAQCVLADATPLGPNGQPTLDAVKHITFDGFEVRLSEDAADPSAGARTPTNPPAAASVPPPPQPSFAPAYTSSGSAPDLSSSLYASASDGFATLAAAATAAAASAAAEETADTARNLLLATVTGPDGSGRDRRTATLSFSRAKTENAGWELTCPLRVCGRALQ